MSMRRKQAKQRGTKHQHPTPKVTPAGGRPHWTLTGALMASAAFAGLATPAFGQAGGVPPSGAPPANAPLATRRFDIPPGVLSAALAEFARATGLTVTDAQALADSVQSPGAVGTFTDEEALRQLLTGTGVTYRFTTARALRLERGELAAKEIPVLPTVTVKSAPRREGQIVSSPKYAGPLRDIPQSIAVVPQSVIEAQGASSLRDVVRNVPGLTVNAGEGGATPGDNFNVRGFSARSDIFVDGVRAAGGYSRETFNIEQVEVTKGPGSAYIGRGSTGGAINLVTKTPHLRRSYGAVLGVGSASDERVTVDLNQPVENVGVPGAAVRVNAEWQDAGVAGLDEVEKNAWGVAPSVALGLGTATRLTFEYLHAHQSNTPSYGIQSNNSDGPPPVDTRHFFGLRDLDFERVDADRGRASVEHQLGAALTLRNQVVWAREDVQRIVTFANVDATRRTQSHITEDETLSNLTNLTALFRTGAVRHSVAAGVELAHEKSFFGRYNFSAPPPPVGDLASPNPGDPYVGTVTEGPARRDATANSAAVYAFETVRLSERWELTGGLRWDYFSPTYRDTLGVELTPKTNSDALSWRAGAVYKPVPHGSVYVAYGTSFNPSGERLAYDNTGTNGLDPEKNRSYEVGTKWDLFGERLSLTAAAFRTDKTNARITDPNDPQGVTVILAGRQRVDGAELGVTGRPLPGWSVFAGYMWLDSEIRAATNPADVGQPLPNVPKHSLNLWTTYRLPWELELGAGARHVSRRIMSRTHSVPPYWTFDAEASYPVTSRVGLRLNLYNLTDETYYDHGRFWVPSPGRSVRLSTTLTY